MWQELNDFVKKMFTPIMAKVKNKGLALKYFDVLYNKGEMKFCSIVAKKY
jgi:hypothetical protein